MKNSLQNQANKNLNIAKYIRESTREQAENGFNLSDQNKKIELYINALDYHYTKLILFEDAGYSAKSLNRPAMKNLINMIKRKEINIVIVHNLDRLTRRVKDLSLLLELFNEYNVDLISITERIDTTSAMGKFFIYLIILIAQWEQETISERTIRGLIESSNQGNYPKGGKLPLGIKRVDNSTKIEIDKENIKIVLDIFEFLIQEKNSSIVSRIINKKYNIKINDTQVIKIIKNTLYNGYYELQNKKYFLNFKVIPDEQFLYANQIINSNSKISIYKYIFNGLIVCDDCKIILSNSCTVKKHKYYLYYVCSKCKYRVSEKSIIKVISEELSKIIEFKELNKTITNLKKKLKLNQITQEEIIKNLNCKINTDTNINILKKLIIEETKIKSKLGKSKRISKTQLLNELSYEEMLKFIKKYIYKIICGKYKNIVIEYKYK